MTADQPTWIGSPETEGTLWVWGRQLPPRQFPQSQAQPLLRGRQNLVSISITFSLAKDSLNLAKL